MKPSYLHTLPEEARRIPSPEKFTYPFYYQPHALCLCAAECVKKKLENFPEWHQEEPRGKMFGVLVCSDFQGERGFLAAYSGNIAGRNDYPYFVPPVYDLLNPDGYFVQEEKAISAINLKLSELESDSPLINGLKGERKLRSSALQRWLFQQYKVHNAYGKECDLVHVFGETIPPGGSGECCAPKLMQAAYRLGLKPLCMAEFWMGPSPKDELRIEGNFYPACRSKCKPILTYMMQGLEVEDNPLLARNREMAQKLEVLFEDDALIVVNKPSGMLAVPGKDDLPSVYDVMKERYPDLTGPVIVHRLDMDTSGLMVLARNEDVYKVLQKQFIGHDVKKHYVALLDATRINSVEKEGYIRLPLCLNPYDRPRQIVSEQYGKYAETRYVLGEKTAEGFFRVDFYPSTGRTHQLRVHAAHQDGLNAPIVGDNLYGNPAQRLCLHAQDIAFTHPVTSEPVFFTVPSDF